MCNAIDSLENVVLKTSSLYDFGEIKGEHEDPDVEFVAFSGGGVAGAAFGGVVRELDEQNIRQGVKYWVGSSAGAICAALTAMGATGEYIIDKLLNTNLRSFLDYGGRSHDNESWWSTVVNYRYGFSELVSKLGTARGYQFKNWFAERMKDLGWEEETTFADLYDKTGIHLGITATSLNTYETLLFTRSSYPYMKIVDAVHVSMILPFLFQPVLMEDPIIGKRKRLLLDGGILDNLPINAFDVTNNNGEIIAFNRKAIGFTLVSHGRWSPEYESIDGLIKYSLIFVNAMHTRIHSIQSRQPYFWQRVIPIETHGVGVMDFDTKLESLQKVIESGHEQTKLFFEERKKERQLKGPLPKNLFIPNPCLTSQYISNDLIECSDIYQTNAEKFNRSKINV